MMGLCIASSRTPPPPPLYCLAAIPVFQVPGRLLYQELGAAGGHSASLRRHLVWAVVPPRFPFASSPLALRRPPARGGGLLVIFLTASSEVQIHCYIWRFKLPQPWSGSRILTCPRT
jgi:hypothetical protein